MWVVNSHFRRSSPIATFRDRENNGTKVFLKSQFFFHPLLLSFARNVKEARMKKRLFSTYSKIWSFFLLSLVFTFLRTVLLSFQVIGQEPVFSSDELSFLPYKNQNQSLTQLWAGIFKFCCILQFCLFETTIQIWSFEHILWSHKRQNFKW